VAEDVPRPLTEHLEELAWRLRKVLKLAAAVFLINMLPTPGSNPLDIVGALTGASAGNYQPIGYAVYYYLVLLPIKAQLESQGIQMRIILGKPGDAVIVIFEAILFNTLLITLPYLVYQIWLFVKPGLYPHEREAVRRYVGWGVALFYIGALFGTFVVSKYFVAALIYFSQMIGVEAIVLVGDVLWTILATAIAAGIVFLTPAVAAALAELGMISSRSMREWRGVAYAGLLILIVIIIPDATLVGTMILFIPFVALYEVAIRIVARIERRRAAVQESPFMQEAETGTS